MYPKLGRDRIIRSRGGGGGFFGISIESCIKCFGFLLLIGWCTFCVWFLGQKANNVASGGGGGGGGDEQKRLLRIDNDDDDDDEISEVDRSYQEDLSLVEKNDDLEEDFINPALYIYKKRNCEDLLEKVDYKTEPINLGRDVEYLSLRVTGSNRKLGILNLYWNTRYVATLFPVDGCFENFGHSFNKGIFASTPSLLDIRQISDEALNKQRLQLGIKPEVIASNPVAKYRVIFSCESSEYFAYQVWANRYGFFHSNQGDATWTRLLTSSVPDDISYMDGFPTFTAPRHPYATRYIPINKPDVITKWYLSKDRPKEKVIAVIDTDNWLLNNLEPYVDKVQKGSGIAQMAYYYGSKRAQALWQKMCKANCDFVLDLVGVPYLLHSEDLETIAPLWSMYTLMIKQKMEANVPGSDEFIKVHDGTGIEWAAEMWGFNFAAAHAGVKFEVTQELQFRDVEGERRWDRLEKRAMLHMGRAWFPKNSKEAIPWHHTEGKSFSAYGDQVWCKCNYTASTIMPWPYPKGTDIMSAKTLDMMHYSLIEYGPIPRNDTFRDLSNGIRHGYSWAHP